MTIGPLVKRLVDLEMPAVAVTDLANLFGLVKFYSAAQSAGIKPIGGCDVVVVGEDGVLTPLVLLVQSEQGYLNLTQLVSQMYTAGDRSGEPRLSAKTSRAERKVLSPCLVRSMGTLAKHFLQMIPSAQLHAFHSG